MKALVLKDGKLALVTDRPRPQRAPGEALIKISVAGICSTDIQLTRGYMNFEGVPGHEFVGVVEEADSTELVGKRVVGEINITCGRCKFCNEGLGRHCPERTCIGIEKRDGAFAEYMTLPEKNLHVVPDGMADDVAVFTEPTAAAFAVLEQITPRKHDRCLVMGDGKLGLLVAQVLAPYCDIKILGRSVRKLSLAAGLGLDAVVAGRIEERDFDIVVDATGSKSGFEGALSLVRPRGTLVLKTTVSGDVPVPLWRIVINEITLVGSRCGLFKPAIEALQKGDVLVTSLISGHCALEDFQAAFAMSRERGIVKVLLYPQGAP